MTDSKPHHHGNLREDLVAAGIALMEEGGIDALSLRKCAARAGVSHSAPAHHFNGVVSLKTAIVARGHELFCEAMQESMEMADRDPYAQLQAICEGYLNFSRAHTAVFKFMFQSSDVDLSTVNPWVLELLEQHQRASYQMLSETCAPFEPWGSDSQSTEVMIWSLVHGYAMLFGGEQDKITPAGLVPEFTEIMPRLNLRTESQN